MSALSLHSGGLAARLPELRAGDRVLLLRVLRGQQFIVLSRIFEKGARHAAKI